MSDTLDLVYELTEGERTILQSLNAQALAAKAKLHDAQTELHAAQQMFSGALAFLATSRGMPGATLSPDFARLTSPR